ncbi:PAS domain-containing protein [Candidatus Bathyarchaeota archaeon]|nr:PAS domain-containing protein [Candidatus Bathyarchaeota archaeon]
MQNAKIQDVLYRLNVELHRFIDTIGDVPYSAMPSEKPEIICFARRIEELTGYTADEILADRQLWMSVVHPADRERVFAAFTRCKNLGVPFEIEYRIIHKDGSLRYVIDEGEPVFNDKGQVTEIEGIITDISEYTKAKICVCQRNPEVTKRNNVSSGVFQKI